MSKPDLLKRRIPSTKSNLNFKLILKVNSSRQKIVSEKYGRVKVCAGFTVVWVPVLFEASQLTPQLSEALQLRQTLSLNNLNKANKIYNTLHVMKIFYNNSQISFYAIYAFDFYSTDSLQNEISFNSLNVFFKREPVTPTQLSRKN